jgi:hypothetical protein
MSLPDLLLAFVLAATPPALPAAATARTPVIATAASDIRPAWSSDGSLRYFGALHPDGRHELMQQSRSGDDWSEPVSNALNFDGAKTFDPFVAADGTLLFFSDRPGGAGGSDLWQARRVDGEWQPAEPVPGVNSPADEWAPSVSPQGEWLLFSSDRAAPGKPHRLYLSHRQNGKWTDPRALDSGDPALYHFDGCFVGTQGTIAFSRSADPGQGSALFIGRLDPRSDAVIDIEPLPAPFANASGYALGCAWHAAEPGLLYVSTALEGAQRLDIHALPLPGKWVPAR